MKNDENQGTLCLSRKIGQSIVIADMITITVHQVKGAQVKIRIEAPRDIPVVRKELKAA